MTDALHVNIVNTRVQAVVIDIVYGMVVETRQLMAPKVELIMQNTLTV